MLKIKFIALASVALMLAAPIAAVADAPKVSYSAKKQGRVHFQEKSQDQSSSQASYENINPANIEPAAGDFKPEMSEGNTVSASDRMRLPRKN